jgi:hypothetical protein
VTPYRIIQRGRKSTWPGRAYRFRVMPRGLSRPRVVVHDNDGISDWRPAVFDFSITYIYM